MAVAPMFHDVGGSPVPAFKDTGEPLLCDTDEECCVSDCTANFTWEQTDNFPCTIQFTNTGSGSAFYWDFGDGNDSTDENPEHEYSTDGPYTVTLEVDGGDEGGGCEDESIVFCGFDCPVCDDALPPEVALTISGFNAGVDSGCDECEDADGTIILSRSAPANGCGSSGVCSWRLTTGIIGQCRPCSPPGFGSLRNISLRYSALLNDDGIGNTRIRATICFIYSSSDEELCALGDTTYQKIISGSPSSLCLGTHTLEKLGAGSLCDSPDSITIEI